MASPQDQGVKPSSTAAAAAATASPLVADETIATREIGHLSLAPPLVFPLGVSAAAMAAHRAQDAEEEQGNGPMAPPPTRVSSCSSGAGQAGGGAQGASRASILDSLMEISLDSGGRGAGAAAAGGNGAMPSAARTMMELKALEKMRSKLNVLAPVPPRNKATAAPTIAHNTHHPSSALEQATAGFAAETGQLASFERSKGSKKGGRKAVLSTKARQRRVAGQEKEEAYNDRLSGRVARRNRRAERMELLRRVY